MALDIGTILFRDILQMAAYPGAPFTGNIIQDLVMFFFIPTVFIIFVVYVLVGKLHEDKKMQILLGIAFYLFIVFSPYGLYSMFAYIAGPYFLFVLIILGIIFFLLGHFPSKRGGGGASAGGGKEGGMGRGAVEQAAGIGSNPYANLSNRELRDTKEDVEKELGQQEKDLKDCNKEIRDILAKGGEVKKENIAEANTRQRISELRAELIKIERALRRKTF